jgi:hypothetical protein
MIPVHPDQVTRFFSADELMSRRDRLEQRGFSNERPTIRGLPVAPSAFAAPSSENRVDQQAAAPPDASAAAVRRSPANDEPVDLPYLWARPSLLGRLRALPPRRVLMLLLVLLSLYRVWVRPISFSPRRAHVTASRPVTVASKAPAKPTERTIATETAQPNPKAPVGAATPPTASAVSPTVTPVTPAPARVSAVGPAAENGKGATLERIAVDAVGEGRYGAALDAYRRLAADEPSKEAYRDAVRILTERLARTQ